MAARDRREGQMANGLARSRDEQSGTTRVLRGLSGKLAVLEFESARLVSSSKFEAASVSALNGAIDSGTALLLERRR